MVNRGTGIWLLGILVCSVLGATAGAGRAEESRLIAATDLGNAYMDLLDSGEVDSAMTMLNPRLKEMGQLEQSRDLLTATMAKLGKRLERQKIGAQATIIEEGELAGAHVQLGFEVTSENYTTIEWVTISVLEGDTEPGVLGHKIDYAE